MKARLGYNKEGESILELEHETAEELQALGHFLERSQDYAIGDYVRLKAGLPCVYLLQIIASREGGRELVLLTQGYTNSREYAVRWCEGHADRVWNTVPEYEESTLPGLRIQAEGKKL